MVRNKLIVLALWGALALSLAGCVEEAASQVSETVSRVESGAGEAASRLEEAGSRVGSAVESALEGATPQPRR